MKRFLVIWVLLIAFFDVAEAQLTFSEKSLRLNFGESITQQSDLAKKVRPIVSLIRNGQKEQFRKACRNIDIHRDFDEFWRENHPILQRIGDGEVRAKILSAPERLCVQISWPNPNRAGGFQIIFWDPFTKQ